MSEERLRETEESFDKLKLQNWTLSGNFRYGGQANTIEVKNTDGVAGVFRTLHRKKPDDIKRFYRELKILTNPKYKHRNIVEILDYTKNLNDQWYISRKGKQFEKYWEDFKGDNNPDKIALKAIEIIKKLALGLMPLHKEKVVHRDIKMTNLVVNNNEPQLIDFGIAYIEDEERITPLNNAAANKFSHQLQLMPGEVPPWLDVFLLSQLLISMTSQRSVKNWEKPLDWRWIVFIAGIDFQIQEKIKAIIAICSNPYTSPQNAQQLIDLIDVLFYEKEIITMEDKNYDEIRKKIQAGKAISISKYSDDREMFEAQAPLFTLTVKKLEDVIFSYCKKIKNEQGLPVEIQTSDISIDEWVKSVLDAPLEDIQHKTTHDSPFRIICGDDRTQKGFEIKAYYFFGSGDMISFPHFIRHFVIVIFIRNLNDNIIFVRPDYHNRIVFSPDGKLKKYLGQSQNEIGDETSVEEIAEMVQQWLSDPKIWNSTTS